MPTTPSSDFDGRQRAFVDRMGGGGLDALERGVIVVLPSISFAEPELRKISGITFYEERMLFALLWLRDPQMEIVYVTSMPVDEAIVDYYLTFLEDPLSARSRLTMVSLDDARPCALSSKLVDRPRSLDVIRDHVGGRGDAYILPFNVTPWERIIAERLDMPLYGPSPEAAVSLGSKSGSRRVARAAGVPVLPGDEDLFSVGEVEDAIRRLSAAVPGIETVVIKLNHGFSGQGNAIVEIDELRFPLPESTTVFCAEEESWDGYADKIAASGAVVERLARHPALVSPSVQMRIAPGGTVEVVSTHDQILGGPDEQVYLGCRFPARSEYRDAIMEHGRSVGNVLAAGGVIGSFGVDFVGLPNDAGYDLYLGEINLRLGGTTHPFLMARMVTDGDLHPRSGELVAGGRSKFYVSSDNLKSHAYRSYTPERARRMIEERGLEFDRSSRTGTTLHLLGAISPFGKLGAVCIADSHEDADALLVEVVGVLDVGA